MLPEPLSKIEQDLRREVASQHYPQVARLVIVFCGEAEAQIRRLPPRDPGIRPIVSHVDEVLRWVHLMLSTARASTAAELSRMSMMHRYLDRAAAPVAALRLDA